MRLTSRSLLGLSSVAAIAISATVAGTALASRGADDAAPTSNTRITDDRGGLTNRDLRTEPGDDRRLNGIPTSPTSVPTTSPSSTPSATSSARPSASSTHRAGDDHGRRHGGRAADDHGRHTGTDDSGHHSGADDSGRHSGRDDSGHHSGTDDSGRHSGRDDSGRHSGRDDHGQRHGGHGSDD